MSLDLNGSAGMQGEFRFIKVNTEGLSGSGPNGEILFEDLWMGEPGNYKPRYPERVTEDRVVKNKFTKRGLSRIMHEILKGHGGTYVISDINAATNTRNPFLAFCLAADCTWTGREKSGDARVMWNESDGQYDTLISERTSEAGEGHRGCAISDTGGIFKRISAVYRSGEPYGEIEYVFYAQPNGTLQSTGVKGLDNFVAKSVGLAYSVDCGDGQDGAQWGVRAVIGLPPTWQGISDRVYLHEPSAAVRFACPAGEFGMHRYTNVLEAVSTDGYICSAEAAPVQIGVDITGNVGDSIDADPLAEGGGGRIVLLDAPSCINTPTGFTDALHRRKKIRISGSANPGNNKIYTIRKVESTTQVLVWETPAVDEGPGAFMAAGDGLYTYYSGDQAFDGRVDNEGRIETPPFDVTIPDQPGCVELGEKWVSADNTGPHMIGRIWSTTQDIYGIRIIVPAGTARDFCPDQFKIEKLVGNFPADPTNPSIWADVGTYSSQVNNIYDAGVYGYEFTFSLVQAKGIKISTMKALNQNRKVEIAEVFVFKYMPSKSFNTTDNIQLSTDGGVTYRTYTPGAVSASQSWNNFLNALNAVLRGYEMEAVRSNFGYIWIRGTVAGNNSTVKLHNVSPGTLATILGLNTAPGFTKTGITQPITKAMADAMTYIYRLNITGNVPGGYV